MELAALAFYIFSFSLLLSAFFVVFSSNPVHSVFFLILSFFNASGLFILAGAEFLAMVLVLVYVGAVAVLFLFVVMMLGGSVINDDNEMHNIVYFFKNFIQLCIFSFLIFAFNIISLYCATWWMDISFNDTISKIFSFPFSWFDFYVCQSIVISIVCIKSFMNKFFQMNLYTIIKNFLRTIPIHIVVSLLVCGEFLALSFLWNSSVIVSEFLQEPLLDHINNTESLGMLIYTEYFYMFQIGGMILLLAMIGAISLTLHGKKSTALRQSVISQISRRKEESLQINRIEIGKGVDIKS